MTACTFISQLFPYICQCFQVFVHIFGPYINKMGIFNTIKF